MSKFQAEKILNKCPLSYEKMIERAKEGIEIALNEVLFHQYILETLLKEGKKR